MKLHVAVFFISAVLVLSQVRAQNDPEDEIKPDSDRDTIALVDVVRAGEGKSYSYDPCYYNPNSHGTCSILCYNSRYPYGGSCIGYTCCCFLNY